MKKLFPLLLLLILCLAATAYADISGQQQISYVTDENGYVTDLTDNDASTAWLASAPVASSSPVTLHLNYATVGEIWVRNGYAYTQNWYNHYYRPASLKVTVYFRANQYSDSYDTYRYQLTDAYRPNSVSQDWNSGYQRLLLPKQYRNVSKIEITVESVFAGSNSSGVAISDIIVAAGNHVAATPKSYATATPKPYVVYITPTPAPYDPEWPEFPEETDPLVEYITPPPTATPLVQLITPTPKPQEYPSLVGVIGYANQRLATRSGPGIRFDEPGSFFQAGQEVKVISKVYDKNSAVTWCQVEFNYHGAWYRTYTPSTRLEVNLDLVTTEPAIYDPLDSRSALRQSTVRFGPGTEYAEFVRGIHEGNRCDVYAIENGWAQIEYTDYGSAADPQPKRRGWVPLDVIY